MSNWQDNISLNSLKGPDKESGSVHNRLAKMCSSFDSEENCQKFKNFPEAYCHTFDLSQEQIHAVTDLDIMRMLKTGGNIKCIEKLTSIYKLSVADLCIQQTGKSIDEVLAEL